MLSFLHHHSTVQSIHYTHVIIHFYSDFDSPHLHGKQRNWRAQNSVRHKQGPARRMKPEILDQYERGATCLSTWTLRRATGVSCRRGRPHLRLDSEGPVAVCVCVCVCVCVPAEDRLRRFACGLLVVHFHAFVQRRCMRHAGRRRSWKAGACSSASHRRQRPTAPALRLHSSLKPLYPECTVDQATMYLT